MRLGINAALFSGSRMGGIQRHTVSLLQAMHRLQPALEIILYSPWPIDEWARVALPFARSCVEGRRPLLYWEQLQLPRLLARDQINIFHSTVNIGVPARPPRSCQTVLTVHDTFTHEEFSRWPRSWQWSDWRAFFHFRLSWRASRHAGGICTVSEYSRRQIERQLGLRARLVVPNAASALFMPGTPDTVSPYILFVGSGDERKGLTTLLEAFRLLEGSPALEWDLPTLVLVGDLTALSPRGRQLLGEIEQKREIKHCDDTALAQLYRGALSVVVPATGEGFGLPVVEAFASGAPVIAADSSALGEVSGGGAALFPAGDAIALSQVMGRMVQDPAWRADWRERGLRRARDFSWEQSAAAMLGLYAELLRSP